MKRILEEINAIKTKVTMLGCFNKKIAGNSQDKKNIKKHNLVVFKLYFAALPEYTCK